MNFECLKEKLEEIVGKTEKVSGKNTTLPVLKCLLFMVDGKNLTIRSTNLDLGLEMSIPVKSAQNGLAAVPAGVIQNFLSNIPNGNVLKIESKESFLSIKSGNYSTIIKLQSHEDFPVLPSVDKKNSIKIKIRDLVNGLKSVWYSCAVSSIKPELSSIYIYPQGSDLIFAATDSFRLSEKTIKTEKNNEFSPILIPFKNAVDMIKVFEGLSDELELCWNQNQLAAYYDGLYLTSRIVDGSFPDYKQIIPKEFVTEAVVLKQDLADILRLSNIFSDKFNKIKIKVSPSAKKFLFESKNDDVGEVSSNLGGALSGEDVEVGFNHKYVSDCLQSISADSVSFQFKGPHSPLVVKGVGDKSFTYLVMPMSN